MENMMSERKPATTIEALDAHLWHLQQGQAAMQASISALSNMATKDDIRSLAMKMELFATKDELKAAEERLRVDNVPTFAKRVGSGLIHLAAAVVALGAIGGVILALARAFDKLPK